MLAIVNDPRSRLAPDCRLAGVRGAAAMAIVQAAGVASVLLGIWLMLVGARGWWTLGLLVAGIVGLLIGR